MKYDNTIEGVFINRPNRFIAHVSINNEVETVHVKNTGRCAELLIPGVRVMLEKSSNPARKTAYDLVCVYKENLGWINMDSQAPNKVVGEWLAGQPECFDSITTIRPEYTFGQSRIDFYIEQGGRPTLIEVKGVTLERDGSCYFPDAPTVRGVKHLNELARAAAEGWQCCIAFVIQIEGFDRVYPNDLTQPEFGRALDNAAAAGVRILYLSCHVTKNELYVVSSHEN